MTKSRHPGDRGLLWIGGFKLLQGTLLAVFAVGVLRFVDQDVAQVVGNWINLLHFDAESGFIAELLQKLSLITDTQLRQLSGLTFVFAGVFLTEGVGLIMKKRWAEYLTVVATGSFIPIELYETIKQVGPVKLMLLGINVAIVWFLIRM